MSEKYKTKEGIPPNTDENKETKSLPQGWSIAYHQGRPYYIDEINRRSQWEFPTSPAVEDETIDIYVQNNNKKNNNGSYNYFDHTYKPLCYRSLCICFFCCWITGTAAVYHAAEANNNHLSHEKRKKHASSADLWNFVTVFAGIILFVIAITGN